MFAGLFAAIIEFVFLIGVCVLVYEIFLSDFIEEKRISYIKKRSEKNSINKVALVKLISDDAKDIEKFISNNAQYLSDEMVNKLVNRIESIKYDKIIYNDSLSQRIDMAAMQTEEAEVSTKKSRKN